MEQPILPDDAQLLEALYAKAAMAKEADEVSLPGILDEVEVVVQALRVRLAASAYASFKLGEV